MQKPNSVAAGHKTGNAATVLVIVGGAAQRYGRVAAADVIVMVDSVDELAGVPTRENLIKVPVGDHETLQTLLERLDGDSLAETIGNEYRDRPNILLSKGMAQDPRIGALVARDLIRRGKLEVVARHVMTMLMVAANGALSHVEVVEANSNAGGMGSGGGPEIGRYFATYIEKFSQATLKHTMVRVGALPYLPVAPRAAANARMATKANVVGLAKQRTPRRIHDVELVELPLRGEGGFVVGGDYELRAWLAGTLLQARRAPEIVNLVDSREVNHRVGEFDEFRRIVTSWSSLFGSRDLVPAAARHYLQAVQQEATKWSEDFRPERAVVVVPGDLDIPAIETVLEELKAQPHLDGPLLTRLLTEDDGKQSHGVVLKTGESSVEMDALANQFARGEVNEDYIGSLVAASRRKLRETEAELTDARARRETGRQALRTGLAAARRKARSSWSVFLTRIESSKDAARRNARLARAFEPLVRSLVQEHTRVARCLESVSVLTKAIEILERSANSKYELLAAALARLSGSAAPDLGHVRYSPLGSVAARLEKAAARSDDALADALMASVDSVTLPGIAAMFGVSTDPASIVTALVECKYAWVAPLWGGASTYAEPRHSLVVFPPMQDGDFEAIRREAGQRGFRSLLRRADSVAAGCAVVALDFFPVDEYADLLPAFYESQPELGGGDLIVLPAAEPAA